MMNRWLLLILVLAALIRFAYQEGMLYYGGNFHNGSDSGKYLVIAETIVETGIFGRMSDQGVQPELNRMPVYPYFLAGIFKIFGNGNLQAVARVQIFIDLITIFGIALSAAAINRALVIPSALVAAVIPNLLVHTSYVLTENLFLLFFTWGMCATLWAIKGHKTLGMLIAAGLLFGIALYTRPVMMFFPLFLFPTLVYAFHVTAKETISRIILLSTIPVIIMLLAASPRVASNYTKYGHVVFTSQSGNHLLKWVYPCLRTPWSCASHGDTWKENVPIIEKRLSEVSQQEKANPFAKDIIMRELGMQRIRELGAMQIVTGMIVGAFKNAIQTGAYETLTQFNQPTTFFSAMQGHSFTERLSNFLQRNRNNHFMFIWALAQAALTVSRMVQLLGMWKGLSDKDMRPYCVFLIATIVYFLAVNGPIGNPKYRIPTEPAFIILFAIGMNSLAGKLLTPRCRKNQKAE